MASPILPPDGCAFIKVGKNDVAIVDADMYDDLSQFKWHLCNGYAVRYWRRDSVQYTESMHRRVNQTPADMAADHINRVRLDNRRANLRKCTPKENSWNIGPIGSAAPEYKGVSHHPRRGYSARIRIGGKRVYLGSFLTAKEAAQAYDSVASDVHGEFAVLNFP